MKSLVSTTGLKRMKLNLASTLEQVRNVLPPPVVNAFDFLKLGDLEELQKYLNEILGQVVRWAGPQALVISARAQRKC